MDGTLIGMPYDFDFNGLMTQNRQFSQQEPKAPFQLRAARIKRNQFGENHFYLLGLRVVFQLNVAVLSRCRGIGFYQAFIQRLEVFNHGTSPGLFRGRAGLLFKIRRLLRQQTAAARERLG
jgi:hypothetical protein